MSKRNTFRPNVQELETRRLMAGDVMGLTGVDDPTVDGDQTTAVIADAVRVANQDASQLDDLTVEEQQQEVGLLLPAVQAAREAARDTDTHTYATGGIYTITVTVVDDDTGQAADAADVVFNELGSDEAAGAHPGGVNILMCDGSARYVD